MIGDDDECWNVSVQQKGSAAIIMIGKGSNRKETHKQPPPPPLTRVNGDKDGLWREIEDG
jgi:hypothetical protein